MNMKQFAYRFFPVLFSLLTACSTTTDPAEAYKGETGQQIFQGGEDALRDHSYAEAIKRFEALDVQYPYGRNIETAQLHIIYAYYKNSDFVAAESAADRFIHAYPSSPNVPYAYYLRGLSSYYQNMGVFERLFSVDFSTRDLTQVKKSFNDFSTIVTHYPDSVYAPAAYQYMIYLRNVLANHQVEVAQFYYERQAYVASANRASLVVEHYQGAPAVPDALVIMAKSYHQLHETDLENDTIHVINFNYPGTEYAHEVTSDRIDSSSVALYGTHQEKHLPPQQALVSPPPKTGEVAANYQTHANGYRGSVPTVAELVKKVRSSGWFKQHGQDAEPATVTSSNKPKKKSTTTLADLWQKMNPGTYFSHNSEKDNTVAQKDVPDAVPDAKQVALEHSNGTR